MKVWVYSGQHDLQIDVFVFSEEAEEKAKAYALAQKLFYEKRLVYSLDLIEVREK